MIQQIRNLANRLAQKKQVKKEQLPRAQRRKIERYESEAMDNANSLCEKFVDFLFNLDAKDAHLIEGEIKNLSGRWIFYCKLKGLNKEAYDLVSNFCNEAKVKYKESVK